MITSYGVKLDRYMNKAFGENYMRLKPKDLVEQIIIDPDISGIDIIVTYIGALK